MENEEKFTVSIGCIIIKGLVELKLTIYLYSSYDKKEEKKTKWTKKCITKFRLKFRNYNSCLMALEIGKETNF